MWYFHAVSKACRVLCVLACVMKCDWKALLNWYFTTCSVGSRLKAFNFNWQIIRNIRHDAVLSCYEILPCSLNFFFYRLLLVYVFISLCTCKNILITAVQICADRMWNIKVVISCAHYWLNFQHVGLTLQVNYFFNTCLNSPHFLCQVEKELPRLGIVPSCFGFWV